MPGATAGSVRHQLPRFILVGCSAAATHLGIVLLLVRLVAGMQPLVANVIAWFCAFWVSWAGHRFLTFAAAPTETAGEGHGQSLRRFFLVSAGAFALNEAAYAVLLQLGLRYDLALVLVLVGVAAATFVASRHWAFAGAGAAGAADEPH